MTEYLSIEAKIMHRVIEGDDAAACGLLAGMLQGELLEFAHAARHAAKLADRVYDGEAADG